MIAPFTQNEARDYAHHLHYSTYSKNAHSHVHHYAAALPALVQNQLHQTTHPTHTAAALASPQHILYNSGRWGILVVFVGLPTVQFLIIFAAAVVCNANGDVIKFKT